MLNSDQKQQYLERFATIESSFRVEGMDPSGLPAYEEAKARILSGELTPEQAVELVCERTAAMHEATAAISR
jgi:hypothetical protein